MKRLVALVAIAIACLVTGGLLIFNTSSPVPQSAAGSVHPAGWGSTPPGYVPPATITPTVTPTATMYDSVNVAEIPAHPYAAAGYTAGAWITWSKIRALARHAVSVAINATLRADCLDIEPGDATPNQAGPWVLADERAGFRKPCEYGDLSNMPAIEQSDRLALGPQWRTRVFLWLAWYRGIPGLVTGYDAVQWSSNCMGRDLDCSTVSLAFLSIAQPPYVAPKPSPPVVTHTVTTPTPPPPAPRSPAVCWGRGAHPASSTCKTVIRRHTWLIDRRNYWQHEYQQCIRHADGIGCARAENWWLLRRHQAIELRARYSA